MIDKIMKLCKKYEEIITYLIVGVLNTIVSWAASWICEVLGLNSDIEWQNAIMNIVGWVAGVLFGYFANYFFTFA